jgi:Xaa-Pro aminopeptidase
MMGLDVHDCARARDARYLGGPLEAGQVLTVEPGLYFQANDETIPPELRGLGIRIEDDVVITSGGYELLSSALPRDPGEIEAWCAHPGKIL